MFISFEATHSPRSYQSSYHHQVHKVNSSHHPCIESLIIAILLKASRTITRQRLTRLHHNRTPKTRCPGTTPALSSNLHPIRNHLIRLRLTILQLLRRHTRRKGIRHIRQIHNGDHAAVVAAEERSSAGQALGDECCNGRDVGHAG